MMTLTQAPPKPADLNDEIGHFERALLTPRLPGDNEIWLKETFRAAGLLGARLDAECEQGVLSLTDDMESQDTDLLKHGERLREKLNELRLEFQGLQEQFVHANAVRPSGEAEAIQRDQLDTLIETGEGFIVHLRQHLADATAWWMESFYRDVGTGD